MTFKNYADILKLTLLVVAVAIIPILVWYLFGVVLMTFGAIILAMLLHLGSQPFMRWLRLPQTAALILSGIVILVILGGTGYMFGTGIINEFQDVVQRATSAGGVIRSNLQESEFGNILLRHVSGGNFSLTGVLPGFLRLSTSFLEAVIVTIISGIYLAAQPRVYRDGIVWLFPPRKHARVAEIVDGIGEGLRLWLLGQLIQMILIGTMVTVAVWIIGVPSPLALGLIAGIAEFIPYLGPILAAIPAILVALTKSPELALWTFVVYIVIHQIEGQIVAPDGSAPLGFHSAGRLVARHRRIDLFVRRRRHHFCRSDRGCHLHGD